MVFGKDGEVSVESLATKVNADLVNNFGNLVHRFGSIIWSKNSRKIPGFRDLRDLALDLGIEREDEMFDGEEMDILEDLRLSGEKCSDLINPQNFKTFDYIEVCLDLLRTGNGYFHKKEPWNMFKSLSEEELGRGGNKGLMLVNWQLSKCLFITHQTILQASLLLNPIIPNSTQNILDLYSNESIEGLGRLSLDLQSQDSIILTTKPTPIFPRIEIEDTSLK